MRPIARGVLASFAVLGLLSIVAPLLAQSDPAVGVWKLNSTKSSYDPGPVPSTGTTTITAVGPGIKISGRGVDAAGKPTLTEYTGAFDGKDTVVVGSPAFDSMSMKRIDANTTEVTRKKAGKVVQTARRVISQDGKTMTLTTIGTDGQGRKINNVTVYEKQ